MYKLLLCQRYLRTRYIALASIISVMLGVATMIVVNSVMAGFSTEMRSRIHGILADMVIEASSTDGVVDADAHLKKVNEVAGEYIEAMSPTVEIYGMLSFQWVGQWITRPVTLIGVEPESKSKVSDITEHLGLYQAEKDDAGNITHPPVKTSPQPPDWELVADYLEYRRLKAEQSRFFNENRLEGDPAHAEQTPTDDGDLLDALESNSKPADRGKTSGVDPAAPLPARLYVGAGLISFPYEDPESKTLKTMWMVRPGDDVKISTVNAGRPPTAVHFNATIVDVFKSGMSEYDSNLVFVNLDYLQTARGMFDPSTGVMDPVTGEIDPKTCLKSITTIQIRLKNFRDADKVIARLRAAFPPGMYTVRTWEQKQGPLLAAVAVESAILNVLLFLIIAVAGFGILAIFFMIVVEKTRDIGILKALGASSNGIMSIFLAYGLGLGIVGSGVGVIFGLLFVYYINEIEAWLTWLTGVEVFDEKIYYFPNIPTHTEPLMVMWVALGAMAIAVLASILPARRAARLHPVQALRYE